jgi:hypothetical protein
MSEAITERLYQLMKECNEDCRDGDCADCCVMEEINEIRSFDASRLSDEDLEYYCEGEACKEKHCKQCAISKEIDWRRQIRTGRDVAHNGSIIKGGGVCKPEWMDDDQYGEYKMTAEYAYEVSYVGFDEPDEDDYY